MIGKYLNHLTYLPSPRFKMKSLLFISTFLAIALNLILAQETITIHVDDSPPTMKDMAMDIVNKGMMAKDNYETITKTLAEKLSVPFGKNWNVIMGPKETVLQISYPKTGLLWFSYGTIQIVLFKAAHYSQMDLLMDARMLTVANVMVTENHLNATMHTHAITVAMTAIKTMNTFYDVAMHISNTFNAAYGNYWQTFVGPMIGDSFETYDKGQYINFTYGYIKIILFKTM